MNAHASRIALAAIALTTLAFSACSRTDECAPPDIRLGRDECIECGMIISEDRFSCSMVVVDQGHMEPQLFDDIGDMVDYERSHPGMEIKRRYVHDYDSRAWIPASTASYALCESIHTPMGSGLIAFSTPAAAEKFARDNSGKTIPFSELPDFRKQWHENRHSR